MLSVKLVESCCLKVSTSLRSSSRGSANYSPKEHHEKAPRCRAAARLQPRGPRGGKAVRGRNEPVQSGRALARPDENGHQERRREAPEHKDDLQGRAERFAEAAGADRGVRQLQG